MITRKFAKFGAALAVLAALAAGCSAGGGNAAPVATGIPVASAAAPTVIAPTATTVRSATAAPTASVSPTTAATAAPAPTLAPTATACNVTLTPAQTEGPYYLAGAPMKASLFEAGMAGTRVLLTGRVLTSLCAPVAGAIVDVWQADDSGVYDLKSYRLRGKVTADAQGNYAIETILPGLYSGRTRHIHVKITIPGGPTVTSQVYFPDESANKTDGIFDGAMLAKMSDGTGGAKMAMIDFIVKK
ncbi:MAG: intradiol ring-cleavage dioxygenase [Thermoflexales bacterium]